MARYRTTCSSPLPPEEVFDYLARFSNAAEWDPGVAHAEDVTPGPTGMGSVFRLVTVTFGRRIPLEYRVVEYERPRRVVVQAENSVLRSTDEILVEASPGGGSLVHYDALLEALMATAVSGPLLALGLRHIGDRAADGLRRVLGSPGSPPALPGTAWPRLAAGRAADVLLEATVVGSFTRLGIGARRRVEGWTDLPNLAGKVMVVTGASSGIGRAAGVELARLGAEVWLLGRDPERTAAAAAAARQAAAAGAAARESAAAGAAARQAAAAGAAARESAAAGAAARGSAAAGAAAREARGHRAARIESAVLDVTDAEAVVAFAARFAVAHDRLDALVHNAGALFPEYRQSPDGCELTVATHVLAPFRLTRLLASQLQAAGRAGDRPVIVTVASGGMYTERFDLSDLEMGPDGYRGTTAYARAKRAQVVLSHEWARRYGADDVASWSMHPGWVSTPGLDAGLPSFNRLGPLLRTPAEGADTVVWLAADGPRVADPAAPLDGFWLDRRRRGEYHLPGTRPRPAAGGGADTEGARLWDWCAERTGVGGPADTSAPGAQ